MDGQFPWQGVRDALLTAADQAGEEAANIDRNINRMDYAGWEQTSEALYDAYMWVARMTRRTGAEK